MTALRLVRVTVTATVTLVASFAALPTSANAATTSNETAAAQLTHSFGVPAKSASLSSLNTLRVANDGSMTGYSREEFPHWQRATAWGWTDVPAKCNARNAALLRDGTNVKVDATTCKISGGTWLDPYTGAWYSDAQRNIQIDHVVPLAEAWRTGASAWNLRTRTQFANDPLVAMSVQGAANNAKGDKGPEAWKPANKAAHCLYAKRYTAIKVKYQLTVSAPEKAALTSMIGTCAS